VALLNPDSPVPLYRQLADVLRRELRRGRYRAGERIPSEHELAREFAIGRPTVRQATDVLIQERLLARRRGAGTFVCPAPEELDLFSLAGTSAALAQGGHAATMRLLVPLQLQSVPRVGGRGGEQGQGGQAAAEVGTGEPGNPFDGERAYFLSRLHHVDKGPVLLEEIYLDPEVFPGIDRFDLRPRTALREAAAAGRVRGTGSISQLVAEHYYLRPIRARQSFRVGGLVGSRARALEVTPAAPVLQVRRWLDFPNRPSAVYSELFCRTDRFAFAQTLVDLQPEIPALDAAGEVDAPGDRGSAPAGPKRRGESPERRNPS